MNTIISKLTSGSRLSEKDSVFLYDNLSFNELASCADKIREEKHPEGVVTYIQDRNINYTNICVSKCRFCAFHAENEGQQPYILSDREILKKVEETINAGGVQILLQGGMNPALDIGYFENLLKTIKSRYEIHLHALSPPEIIFLSEQSGISVADVIKRLIEAGLDSIPGGGAEILSDGIRKAVSPNKYSSRQWLGVMESAHELGLKTTATMVIGMGETIDDRMTHLSSLRDLQDRTHGFTAFILWTYQPFSSGIKATGNTAFSYLKMLALSRIFLDNFNNLQVSWVTQGSAIAQLGLHCGANDFGSTMMEENVVKAAGVSFRMHETEIRDNIRDAGFIPKRRNMKYQVIE